MTVIPVSLMDQWIAAVVVAAEVAVVQDLQIQDPILDKQSHC